MSGTAFSGRRLLTAALATSFALTATACSGGETSGADTAAYDNADVLAEMTDAVADEGSVRLTLGTKQSPEDITVDSSWGGDEPAFRALTGGDPAQQLDVRRVGSRVYVGGEVVGHQWTYLEVDDPRITGAESGFDAGPVPTLLAIDVPGDLAALESAVSGASDEGAEEIDGQETDHYSLTVDTQEWFDGLGESSMYRTMELPETVTMDLYVDDDSLPVRLAYEVPDKPEASAQIGFTDWGSPVEVTVPQRAKPVS
jgi:hypothetical protein